MKLLRFALILILLLVLPTVTLAQDSHEKGPGEPAYAQPACLVFSADPNSDVLLSINSLPDRVDTAQAYCASLIATGSFRPAAPGLPSGWVPVGYERACNVMLLNDANHATVEARNAANSLDVLYGVGVVLSPVFYAQRQVNRAAADRICNTAFPDFLKLLDDGNPPGFLT